MTCVAARTLANPLLRFVVCRFGRWEEKRHAGLLFLPGTELEPLPKREQHGTDCSIEDIFVTEEEEEDADGDGDGDGDGDEDFV